MMNEVFKSDLINSPVAAEVVAILILTPIVDDATYIKSRSPEL